MRCVACGVFLLVLVAGGFSRTCPAAPVDLSSRTPPQADVPLSPTVGVASDFPSQARPDGLGVLPFVVDDFSSDPQVPLQSNSPAAHAAKPSLVLNTSAPSNSADFQPAVDADPAATVVPLPASVWIGSVGLALAALALKYRSRFLPH